MLRSLPCGMLISDGEGGGGREGGRGRGGEGGSAKREGILVRQILDSAEGSYVMEREGVNEGRERKGGREGGRETDRQTDRVGE